MSTVIAFIKDAILGMTIKSFGIGVALGLLVIALLDYAPKRLRRWLWEPVHLRDWWDGGPIINRNKRKGQAWRSR